MNISLMITTFLSLINLTYEQECILPAHWIKTEISMTAPPMLAREWAGTSDDDIDDSPAYYRVDDTGKYLYGGQNSRNTYQWSLLNGSRRKLVGLGSFFPRRPLMPMNNVASAEMYTVQFADSKIPDLKHAWRDNTRKSILYAPTAGDGGLVGWMGSAITVHAAKGNIVDVDFNPQSMMNHLAGLPFWTGGIYVGTIGGPKQRSPWVEDDPTKYSVADKLRRTYGFDSAKLDQSNWIFKHGNLTRRIPVPKLLRGQELIDNPVDWGIGKHYVWTSKYQSGTTEITQVSRDGLRTYCIKLPAVPYRPNSKPTRLADRSILYPYIPSYRVFHGEIRYRDYRTGTFGPIDPNDQISYLYDPASKTWNPTSGWLFYGTSSNGKYVAYSIDEGKTLNVARVP